MVNDEAVRKGLDARRGEWKEIAASAGVSHSWISQFVRGLIANPGYRTLETIQRVLDGERRHQSEVDAKAA